jgi:Ser/Thr protein kinase RdoA (MazF antagonist)
MPTHEKNSDLPFGNDLKQLNKLAALALDCYALPAGVRFNLINLSENVTFKVEHSKSKKRWALRIHRPGYHTKRAIASEIAWLTDLRRQGVVMTPIPVAGLNKEIIQVFSEVSGSEPLHVVLYEWEEGSEPSVDNDLRSSFEILGAVTARMHLHSRSWNRPEWFERMTWNFETSLGSTPHWGCWRDGLGVDGAKRTLFSKTVDLVQKRLSSYGTGPERFGLVHCDLRLANLLIHGDEVKVIDFDDCGFGWYMYDAATPVSFYEHQPEVSDLICHWLKGYRTVSGLSQDDEDEIPTFLMLRRLLLVAWIGSHSYTDLAKSMGLRYTNDTVGLCQNFLQRFG